MRVSLTSLWVQNESRQQGGRLLRARWGTRLVFERALWSPVGETLRRFDRVMLQRKARHFADDGFGELLGLRR